MDSLLVGKRPSRLGHALPDLRRLDRQCPDGSDYVTRVTGKLGDPIGVHTPSLSKTFGQGSPEDQAAPEVSKVLYRASSIWQMKGERGMSWHAFHSLPPTSGLCSGLVATTSFSRQSSKPPAWCSTPPRARSLCST